MSILFCLGTKKGHEVLEAMPSFQKFCEDEFFVCSREEKNVKTNYGPLIKDRARYLGYEVCKRKDITPSFIERKRIDTIVCVGWVYLIDKEVLNLVHGRVIVIHDSLLPKYRGFAPLPTALINGEKEVGATVLFADSKPDAGDIIYQRSIEVKESDNISDLIDKVSIIYIEGLRFYFENRAKGLSYSTKQDHSQATYSIWRDERDYWIDWSLDSNRIQRTIRALGSPYLGAKTTYKKEIEIQRATIGPDMKFEIRDVGKIWNIDNNKPLVICGQGTLLINKAVYPSSREEVIFDKLRIRLGE